MYDLTVMIVGSSPPTPGVAEGLVCDACSGDGVVFNEELCREIPCEPCSGRGGSDPSAVSRARAFSQNYAAALGVQP